MKILFLVSSLLVLGAAQAKADGFVCVTPEQDLKVQVYNHTQPELGTRNAAAMVISDPQVSVGRRTIARFSDTNLTLSNDGATYEADVDLRYNDSGRQGELISGTKLGFIDTIVVDVAFTYTWPVAAESEHYGLLRITKRNGEEIERELSCTRYLKNQ